MPVRVLLVGLLLCAACAAPDPVLHAWPPGPWTPEVRALDRLPDFSHAGYRSGNAPIDDGRAQALDATAFGVRPDDGEDDGAALQAAIDEAERLGGAVVRLPAGRLDLNVGGDGPFVQIGGDGVLLRGVGDEVGGTELHLRRPLRDVRRHAMIFVRGDFRSDDLTELTAPAERGDTVLEVGDTTGLSAGQLVRLERTDPDVHPDGADPSRAELAALLTAPFPLAARMWETAGPRASRVPTIHTVAEVLDGTHVRLARPLRTPYPLSLQPAVRSYHPVTEVGIEGIRFTTAWPGQYVHHRPFPPDATGDAIVRSTEEQDYLWTAIQLARSAHCWVRDVTLVDANQGVMLYEAAHVTLSDLRFAGHLAHVGVGLTRSHENLVEGARLETRFVHGFLAAEFSSGNVVTDSEATVSGFDAASTADSVIDHHGLMPYENLYDDLRGLYVVAGGPEERLPHAGVRNTFWNLHVPARMDAHDRGGDELFRTYDGENTSSGTNRTAHEHWPASIVVGVTREGERPVLVGGSADDRRDAWLEVEGLNRPLVQPPSLYRAQLAERLGR
jgi:hypothetical protein